MLPDETDQLPADAFYTNPRVLFYKQTAEQRGYSPAIVLKMLSRNLEVMPGNWRRFERLLCGLCLA